MREKVAKKHHEDIKIYSKEHWNLFFNFRKIAYKYLEILKDFHPIIHGSIVRGDIHKKSDVDIMFLNLINEYQILSVLDIEPTERWLVQATPLSAIKGVLIFPEITISFPLIPLYPREEEFYRFGGLLTYEEIKNDLYKRISGVNKKLLFILPTENGHAELRVDTENASVIAKKLKISIETVLERIRVLEHRDKVGRTGVFLKRMLRPDESFGEVLNQIKDSNPATRRRIRRKHI